MRERPILFSAPMVRAVLAGSKTQTRRVMRVQPSDETSVHVEHFYQTVVDRHGDEQPGPEIFGAWWDDGDCGAKCPYGAPGERLWLRETFYAFGRWETRYSEKSRRDEWHFVDMTLECGHAYGYAADGGHPLPMRGRRDSGVTPGWWKRPAIHIPRIASRITLEVTGVRVERLNAISEADAIAEGADCWVCGGPIDGTSENDCACFHTKAAARDSYRALWEQINGAGSWAANPWVWVIEFRRIEAA